MSVITMKPSKVYEFIVRALVERDVPLLLGPPAIGKSKVVHEVGVDTNAKLIDLRLSQYLSEDMTGLPEKNHETGKAEYLPFDRIPLEGDPIPDGYSGWLLFLDEISSATEEVLAATYSILLDHEVGGKKIHPKCLVIAAGNRQQDSAIARELPDTILTRCLPVEMETNTNDWLTWATRPETKSNEAVVEFIKKNPSQLYAFVDKGARAENETYATPRGWEKVMKHVNRWEKICAEKAGANPPVDQAGVPIHPRDDEEEKYLQPLDDITFALCASAVGRLAAQAFREEYDESIQLPYPWEIAQSPSSSRIPGNAVGKATLTDQLAKYYLESDDQSQDAVLTYMNRLGGEYSELFLSKIKEGMGETPSDKRRIERVAQRLSIDPLLGTAPSGGGGNNKPF